MSKLSRIPLTRMSDNTLREYVGYQVMDFPVKLTKEEKKMMYSAMIGSVQYMTNKCMVKRNTSHSQPERPLQVQVQPKANAVPACKPAKAKKTHHIYV